MSNTITASNTIIAADAHVLKKPGMWAGRAEIAGDDLYSLEQIIQACTVHDADLMLLGDTLDSATNLPRPLVALKQAFSRMPGVHLIRYVVGQHEFCVGSAFDDCPWLSLIDRTEHIAKKSFGFHGYKAYALDYFPAPFEALQFASVPKDVEVLFLHGTVDLAMPMGYHFTQESLMKFKKLKHVFAGDYHQPLDLVAGHVHIHYCGSTWQQSVDEPREKSVMLIKGERNGMSISRVPLRTRNIMMLSELCDETGTFNVEMMRTFPPVEDLPKELQMPVILVDMPTNQETYAELAKYGHVYTTSKANPDVPTKEVIDLAEKVTDEEILSRHTDREKFPSEFSFTMDVISSPVADAVARLKEKLGVKVEDHAIKPTAVGTICLTEENPDGEPDEEFVSA